MPSKQNDVVETKSRQNKQFLTLIGCYRYFLIKVNRRKGEKFFKEESLTLFSFLFPSKKHFVTLTTFVLCFNISKIFFLRLLKLTTAICSLANQT